MPFRRGRYIQPSTELVVPAQEILPPREIPTWARSSHEDILEDQLAGIESEMAALQDTIDLDEGRALYEGSLIEFFRAAWNEIDKLPFKLNWHHECIAEHLVAVADGEIKKLLINIPPRTGKALDCDTPILTTWGWKKHGELVAGDFVFGPDGKPKRVLAIGDSSEQECFNVKFDDHASLVASGDHLWEVDRHYQYGSPKWSRIRKRQIFKTVDLIVTGQGKEQRPDYIPVCDPVEFPPKRHLIDPYILGVWLGDGNTSGACIHVGDQDIDHFQKFGRISRTDQPSDRNKLTRPLHRIIPEGLEVRLRLSGILGNKHIPDDYFEGSIEQRWELLRGLMDTDGYAAAEGTCITLTKLPLLAKQIQMLQCSLGLKSFCRETWTTLEGKKYGPYYEISFKPPEGAAVFKLPRKQERTKPCLGPRSRGRYLSSILPVGKRLANCILVEGGVYLAGDRLIKTHNTSLVTVVFPAWLWAQTEQSFLCGPQGSFLCVSYGETPAYKQAATARQLLMGRWYQRYWGDKVKIIKDGLDELRNDRGGYRISSSLAGAILGSGANLRIVDDPHNTQQAESTIDREKTVSLFSEGLTTRRTDPLLSAMIVVMQRLHSDDVSGHVLENEPDYTQLILPMRYDPRRFVYSRWSNDPREEDGELLWPEQFPAEVVDADERTLGPYSFAGQYQQSPVPRGGGIIERNWFRLWPDDSPEMAERATVCSCASCGWMGPIPGDEAIVSCIRCQGQAERKVVYPPFSYRGLFVDTNYGEKEENSWSAAVGIGVWHGKDEAPRAMLMTAWRGRPKLRTPPKEPGARQRPEDKGLVERIHEIATRHQVDEIVIEQKMRGFDLYNELETHVREWPYRLVYFNPTGRGDKVARLNATVPVYTNDLVWAPNKGWAETVINETTTAPRSKYWDLVDCLTMGILYLRHDRNMLALPDEHRREAIRERVLQSQSARFNASEMIEGA